MLNRVAVTLLVGAMGSLCAMTHVTAAASTPEASTPADGFVTGLVQPVGLRDGSAVFRLNVAALVEPRQEAEVALALPEGAAAVLKLERFSIVGPRTRFVVGTIGGADRPAAFDPRSVALYRGKVEGEAESHVYLAVSARSVAGRVDLGVGRPKYLITNRSGEALVLAPGEAAVMPARPGSRSPGVPMCGVPAAGAGERARRFNDNDGGGGFQPRGGPVAGMQHLQLAVETDFEYFEILGNEEDAGEYLVQLYGAVSDIFIRDVNTRVELSFVRLWDNPSDLFNEPDPLGPFQQHWNNQMQNVVRDTAQFLSGRRDLGAGGTAWVSALCGPNGYSWVGYALGRIADPDQPDWANRDIVVTAHELGHNCGTLHTHDYGLDTCHDPSTQPRRGSIMAYCGQTFSGGDANHDLFFHTFTADRMREHIFSRNCIADDCNRNGRGDAQDISQGFSADANANGRPDECEDCNGNGRLDPLDISQGFSTDVNGNGLPDECEPDCNDNDVPDARDIQLLTSQDANGDAIPDECQRDEDGNGTADHVQINADMSLDANRNLRLDSEEDCDGDGTTDAAELDHAWNVYVANENESEDFAEVNAVSGVVVNHHGPGLAPGGQDLVITPTRRVLISSDVTDGILEFNDTGALVGTLIPSGSGGLGNPGAMLLTPSGTIMVANRANNSVNEYYPHGQFARVFVQPGAGGLTGPFGLTFGPNGNLFVSGSDNTVREYSRATGAFVRTLVAPGAGGLNDPRGLLFLPDGSLLVCNHGGSDVLRYDGVTGASLGRWSRNGTADRLTLEEPWCIRFGPNGNVFVSRHGAHMEPRGGGEGLHLTKARIYEFDVRNGNFERSFVLGDDTNIYHPTGFDWMPGSATDCNRNGLPDSCDITSGTSSDANGDGIPDECQPCPADFNGDGFVTGQDFDDFVNAFEAGGDDADFNGDGFVTGQDFDDFVGAFEAGC